MSAIEEIDAKFEIDNPQLGDGFAVISSQQWDEVKKRLHAYNERLSAIKKHPDDTFVSDTRPSNADISKKFIAFTKLMNAASDVIVNGEGVANCRATHDLGDSIMVELEWFDRQGTLHSLRLEEPDLAELNISDGGKDIVIEHINGETFRFRPVTTDLDIIKNVVNDLGNIRKPGLKP